MSYDFPLAICFTYGNIYVQCYSLSWSHSLLLGFRDNSIGKESACNAGDPGSIPGLGRSAREEIGYPCQYFWASFVAQLVKNLPAMQETLVRFLGQEDQLEKGTATHSSILGLPWWLWW